MPGPQFKGVSDVGSAEASYYTWVDWFNTSGSGENVPITTGNQPTWSCALVNGKCVDLRVPYPLGYLHQVRGRPDRRSEARLEGQGLWTTVEHAHHLPQ